jgi:hypothetical protein
VFKLVPFRNFANIGFKSRVAQKMLEKRERKEIKEIRRNIRRTGDHSKLLYDPGSKETAIFKDISCKNPDST